MTDIIKVPAPDGNGTVDGIDVQIDEAIERWSDYKLSDGTQIRVKQNVLRCVKILEKFDPDGNPVYMIQSVPLMTVISTAKVN